MFQFFDIRTISFSFIVERKEVQIIVRNSQRYPLGEVYYRGRTAQARKKNVQLSRGREKRRARLARAFSASFWRFSKHDGKSRSKGGRRRTVQRGCKLNIAQPDSTLRARERERDGSSDERANESNEGETRTRGGRKGR